MQGCPYFTEWSEWTDCSLTCGGGSRSKVRECKVPRSAEGEDSLCDGAGILTERCNDNACPYWSEWTEWMQVNTNKINNT